MERSLYGGTRTKVFFCDPNRSDQKGACEVNHKLIRNIIPQGTPIDDLTQADANLITTHINSYVRKGLYDKCPYDIASHYYRRIFLLVWGLSRSRQTR